MSDEEVENPNIRVTIRDMKTGVEVVDESCSEFWWSDGNGSCDCNREILFGERKAWGGNCLGCVRYRIVKAESLDGKEIPLRNFDSDYRAAGVLTKEEGE